MYWRLHDLEGPPRRPVSHDLFLPLIGVAKGQFWNRLWEVMSNQACGRALQNLFCSSIDVDDQAVDSDDDNPFPQALDNHVSSHGHDVQKVQTQQSEGDGNTECGEGKGCEIEVRKRAQAGQIDGIGNPGSKGSHQHEHRLDAVEER